MKFYKEVRVVYDAHQKSYDVEYRNWFVWKYDQSYKFDVDKKYPIHYRDHEKAKAAAIERAKAMLDTTIVFKQSNYGSAYYC